MHNPDKRAVLIEAVIAGGLIAIGIPTGQVPLLTLAAAATSVGCNWTHSLTERGFQHWCSRWFTDDGVLNHDITKALCHAFEEAVRQVEHDWKNQRHYQHLRRKSPKEAQLTLDTLHMLHEDGANLFQQPDHLTQVVQQEQHDRVLSLLSQDEFKASEYLKPVLSNYLYGHDDELVTFVTEQLSPKWIIRFLEILKDPSEEGTRAWRACQLLWQQSLMLGIDQIQRTTAETADTVRWLQEWAQQLKSQLPTQRNPIGQDALEEILRSTHVRLDEIQATTGRIEMKQDKTLATAGRIETKLEQVLTFGIPAEIVLRHIWKVPYHHNQYFTDREDVLKRLHDALRRNKAALTQPLATAQALSGLGGIGKTQTAVEYAYRFRKDYHAVLWLQADSPETLFLACVELAQELKLPEQYQPDQTQVVEAVKRWLVGHTQWLLILDNVEDLQVVNKFLPPGHHGSVLLTTRMQATGHVAQRIEIEKMETTEGALFLLRRASIIAAAASIADASSDDFSKAKEITEKLHGLPLALDQAGAYIEETACSLSDYLELYLSRRAALLKRRGETSLGHPEPVATTWSLSFEKVKKANPAAAELLRLCAFLHPDAIPVKIIMEGAAELGPLLGPVASDRLKLDEVIRKLLNYSLVHRYADGKMLSIHPLVQTVLKDAMDEKTQIRWAERTVRAVNRAFEQDKLFDDPDLSKVELRWNLLAIADEVERRLPPDIQFRLKLHKAKLHQLRFIEDQPGANKRLALTEAEGAFELAEGLGEAAKGQASLAVAEALNMLQRFPEATRRAKEACEAAQRAGDNKTMAHGLRLRATLETHHNSEFGDVALLEQARRVLEQNQPGQTEARLILSILWDEAVLALRHKKWVEFEKIMPRIEELETGPYQRATIMQYYGEAYTQQGKWEKSLPFLQRAHKLNSDLQYKIGECAAMGWWGIALCRLGGKYDEGISKVREALRFEEKILNSREGVAKWLVALAEYVYIPRGEMKPALEVLWMAEKLHEELYHIHLERTRRLINEIRNKIGEKEFTRFKETFKPRESNFADYLPSADTI